MTLNGCYNQPIPSTPTPPTSKAFKSNFFVAQISSQNFLSLSLPPDINFANCLPHNYFVGQFRLLMLYL